MKHMDGDADSICCSSITTTGLQSWLPPFHYGISISAATPLDHQARKWIVIPEAEAQVAHDHRHILAADQAAPPLQLQRRLVLHNPEDHHMPENAYTACVKRKRHTRHFSYLLCICMQLFWWRTHARNITLTPYGKSTHLQPRHMSRRRGFNRPRLRSAFTADFSSSNDAESCKNRSCVLPLYSRRESFCWLSDEEMLRRRWEWCSTLPPPFTATMLPPAGWRWISLRNAVIGGQVLLFRLLLLMKRVPKVSWRENVVSTRLSN